MDTTTFSTQTVKTQPAGTTQAAAALSKSGMFAATAGMDFMDLIFAQLVAQGIVQQTSTAEGGSTATTPDFSGASVLTAKGSLEDLEALEQQVSLQTDDLGATGASASLVLPPHMEKKLLAMLQSFMNGLPQDGQPTLETLQDGLLKQVSLEDFTVTAADGDASLIVSGLTPQQLTDLLKKMQEGDETDASTMMVGMIQIVPPEVKKETLFMGARGSMLPTQAQPAQGAAEPVEPGPSTPTFQLTALGTSAQTPDAGEKPHGFERVLRIFESAQKDKYEGLDNLLPKNSPAMAGNSAVAAQVDTQAGALNNTASWTTVFPEGLSLGGLHGPHGLSLTLNGTAQMTSLVSNAPQASTPHPATQQIAAALTASVNGETRSMTLKLDPPELGHVSVKLEFKDDKTLKAVVMAEKPETYMMMQRDSHVLQKALADAGLDTGGNGLTFQLSQDGGLAGNNDGNRGGGSNTYTPSSQKDELVVETRMDWTVDPQTGVMHYDILA